MRCPPVTRRERLRGEGKALRTVFAALALAATLAAGGIPARAAPARVLTEDEIAQLERVVAWEVQFSVSDDSRESGSGSGEWVVSSTAAGNLVQTSWSRSRSRSKVYSGRLTFGEGAPRDTSAQLSVHEDSFREHSLATFSAGCAREVGTIGGGINTFTDSWSRSSSFAAADLLARGTLTFDRFPTPRLRGGVALAPRIGFGHRTIVVDNECPVRGASRTDVVLQSDFYSFALPDEGTEIAIEGGGVPGLEPMFVARGVFTEELFALVCGFAPPGEDCQTMPLTRTQRITWEIRAVERTTPPDLMVFASVLSPGHGVFAAPPAVLAVTVIHYQVIVLNPFPERSGPVRLLMQLTNAAALSCRSGFQPCTGFGSAPSIDFPDGLEAGGQITVTIFARPIAPVTGPADLIATIISPGDPNASNDQAVAHFLLVAEEPLSARPQSGPLSELSPDEQVEASGEGFAPNSDVEMTFESTPVTLGRTTANAAGRFAITVRIPSDAQPGPHTLRAVGIAPGGLPRVLAVGVTVVPGDSTAPTTTAVLSPPPNARGWHRQQVTVELAATDDASGVAQIAFALAGAQTAAGTIAADRGSVTIAAEGETVVTYFARDNAGNVEAARSLTVRIDTTAPRIATARTPAPNAHGWNNGDVTARASASDALSGLADPGAAEQVFAFTAEGAGQRHTFAVADLAGNVATATVEGVSIDRTAPAIVGSRTPPANARGWNNGSVVVGFACSDALSGLAACSGPTTLDVEGAGQVVSGAAEDRAGNRATAAVSGINIDRTPPVVRATRSPEANANGWNNSEVTLRLEGSDALSGLEGPTLIEVVLSSEGVNQSAEHLFTDAAGNTALARLGGISIDKTAPLVSCTNDPLTVWPPNHRLVSVTNSVVVTDALSGPGPFALRSATSSEPDEGLGDGDLASDLADWDTGTADTTGLARAERSGLGTGRTYTFSYEARDLADNAATCATTVVVPRDQRR